MVRTKLIPLLVVILSCLLQSIATAFTTPPIPIANQYFESMPVYIKTGFSTTFSSSSQITKTIPFTKTYTQAPMVAYALKNYRSNFGFIQQVMTDWWMKTGSYKKQPFQQLVSHFILSWVQQLALESYR